MSLLPQSAGNRDPGGASRLPYPDASRYRSTAMSSRILYCGDPHGHWTQIYRAAERCRPAAVVLLGDFDLEHPLDAVMEPVMAAGAEVYWIAGNHEGDTDPWHDNVFR